MINIAIVGYGNLGRGVKKAVEKNPDMKLIAIFTRRLEQVKAEVTDLPVLSNEKAFSPLLRKKVEVMVLCSGSKAEDRKSVV